MIVRISRQQTFTKTQALIVQRDDSWGNKARVLRKQALGESVGGVDD